VWCGLLTHGDRNKFQVERPGLHSGAATAGAFCLLALPLIECPRQRGHGHSIWITLPLVLFTFLPRMRDAWSTRFRWSDIDQPINPRHQDAERGRIIMHLPRRRPLQRGQSALQLPADKPSLPSGDCTECLDGLWGCPSVEMHRSAGAVGRQKRAELIVEKFNLRSPTQHEQTATQQRDVLCYQRDFALLFVPFWQFTGNTSLLQYRYLTMV
jgi:hypothetical protein